MNTENGAATAAQNEEAGHVAAPDAPTATASARRGIRVCRLRLKGVNRDYEVNFQDAEGSQRSLSVIAGAFSTGKSSILEFIAYCLGGSDHPQHPEILRKVRSALLEVHLDGQPHVIERAVGSQPSASAFVRTGTLSDVEIPPTEKRMIKPAGDPNSLSSLLLSYCGLEGVELREAPTQADSGTDPLSIRNLLWLSYMPNERLDDKHLLFESSHMKRLQLGQVVDVVFGIHDNKAAELGRRIKELENRLSRARTDFATTQAFLDEQQLGNRLEIELVRDNAQRLSEQVTRALVQVDHQVRANSTFATELRARYQDASRRAQQAAALVRDRETQLRRLIPLRAQYAADITKLTMLAEARMLFDPLQVKVCPACLTTLREAPHIDDGHCSLCHSETIAAVAEPGLADNTANGRTAVADASSHAVDTEAKFDVSSELRATRARLNEITGYVEDLERDLVNMRTATKQANEEESQLASELDAATGDAVSPFLSQRDDLMRQQLAAAADLDRAKTGIKMLDSVDRRGAAVARLEVSLGALRAERDETAVQPDRNDVIHRISERYANILTAWHYPKLDQVFIDSNLVPHMRGMSYTNASSGGRTLISLAWILAIFQVAWETNSSHPGFLMIDSPQKNLGQGGDRDAEFADSVAVTDFYQHLHDWLAGSGHGAQIIIVDNAPPASADPDVVIRYSRRADQPPYGLIEDEVS